ncbi:uncharacterized protein LOC113567188 [Drosophila persimilis]|uniref:uncharacterized protein LOC113567188 n=1 Tax=Drosophila persimilis TaxID=7234 RepID=UPI000F07CC5E|nr:uncharacterized protein LOC113567188 [Drosophila persimilis]XP_026850159.1 uncharacterized protein LOC113567188 [Drosophila persimilis]
MGCLLIVLVEYAAVKNIITPIGLVDGSEVESLRVSALNCDCRTASTGLKLAEVQCIVILDVDYQFL